MLSNLTRTDGWLTQLNKTELKQENNSLLVNEAYLRTLSRFPDEIEMKESLQYLKSTGTLKEGLHDLLWVLLNTQEFITNH